MAEPPVHRFVTVFEDSARWRNISRRPGDIVISTPPKCGTTLTQGIVRSLLWPAGDAPGSRSELSPWIDMRMTPIDQLADQLTAQTHRRFVKTHSPGDCIPFDATCQYIVVYRDGRDSLVSWGNHRSKMRSEVVEAINAVAAKAGVAPVNAFWDGDYDELFDEWEQVGSPVRHLGSWWPRRHHDNVLFVHYADLSADLAGEMERIAGFLDLRIDDELWPGAIERCSLDSMRGEAETRGGMDHSFKGGASAFFFKGTNGRWRDILNDAQLDRYLDLVAESLDIDAAAWLEHGSRALERRPSEIGTADSTTLDTGRWHPLFSRMGKQPANSLDAIAERRVEEARDQGLFDDLALTGKPIPDLDQHRPPGWWANQFVAKERNKVTAMQLEEDLRNAMPGLWRLETERQIADRVAELNEMIDDYNRVTTLSPRDRLTVPDTLATWRKLKARD